LRRRDLVSRRALRSQRSQEQEKIMSNWNSSELTSVTDEEIAELIESESARVVARSLGRTADARGAVAGHNPSNPTPRRWHTW
jgi:hypothetical protein